MKHFTILLTLFVVTTLNSISQDIITPKKGDDIEAEIIEISLAEIQYKKFNNLSGKTFRILKSEVLSVQFANGVKQTINEVTKTDDSLNFESKVALQNQGMSDAQKHYKNYKGGASATFIVSAISPLAGLIPAIICSTTPPKNETLNYPDPNLIQKPGYLEGYRQQSHRIKSKKIWSNWAIAFGANAVATIYVMMH